MRSIVNMDRDARWVAQSPTTMVFGNSTAVTSTTTLVVNGTGTLYTDRFQGSFTSITGGTVGNYAATSIGFSGHSSDTPFRICVNGWSTEGNEILVWVGTYASQTSATSCQLIGSGTGNFNMDDIVIVDGTSDVAIVIGYYFNSANASDKYCSCYIQDLTSPDTDYVKVAP
jgi:hypothetical protein